MASFGSKKLRDMNVDTSRHISIYFDQFRPATRSIQCCVLFPYSVIKGAAVLFLYLTSVLAEDVGSILLSAKHRDHSSIDHSSGIHQGYVQISRRTKQNASDPPRAKSWHEPRPDQTIATSLINYIFPCTFLPSRRNCSSAECAAWMVYHWS